MLWRLVALGRILMHRLGGYEDMTQVCLPEIATANDGIRAVAEQWLLSVSSKGVMSR